MSSVWTEELWECYDKIEHLKKTLAAAKAVIAAHELNKNFGECGGFGCHGCGSCGTGHFDHCPLHEARVKLAELEKELK